MTRHAFQTSPITKDSIRLGYLAEKIYKCTPMKEGAKEGAGFNMISCKFPVK